jgi:hypothetical protein
MNNAVRLSIALILSAAGALLIGRGYPHYEINIYDALAIPCLLAGGHFTGRISENE